MLQSIGCISLCLSKSLAVEAGSKKEVLPNIYLLRIQNYRAHTSPCRSQQGLVLPEYTRLDGCLWLDPREKILLFASMVP